MTVEFILAASLAGPNRNLSSVIVFAVCISFLAFRVIRRRKLGHSWNDALADGARLRTGNVWLDGALFAVILVIVIVLVRFVGFRP